MKCYNYPNMFLNSSRLLFFALHVPFNVSLFCIWTGIHGTKRVVRGCRHGHGSMGKSGPDYPGTKMEEGPMFFFFFDVFILKLLGFIINCCQLMSLYHCYQLPLVELGLALCQCPFTY